MRRIVSILYQAVLLSFALFPLRAAAGACSYDVEVSPALVLDVQVACDPGVSSLDLLDRSLDPFVSRVRGERSGTGFAGGYRVDLAAMARQQQSVDSALAVGDSVLAVGSAWLLAPRRSGNDGGSLQVGVHTAPGVAFATGQSLAGGAFEIPAARLDQAGFSAFGRLRTGNVKAADDAFRVVVLDGRLDVGDAALLEWIDDMAGAAAAFWHGFPAPGMPIFVVPRAGGSGVPFGRVMSGGGVSMVLYVGEHATPAELRDDWVLIHELVHTGSPFVYGSPWFAEGLATYFEPLIRARSGLQTPEAMWTEFMTHMPRAESVMEGAGLARGGSRGWYYGGALLMLLADVQMRQASRGRTGLEDCLRRIRVDIGDFRRVMGVRDMIAACDAAVGGHVLSDLVQEHAFAAGSVDLEALWRDLGLRLDGDRLHYADDAPLAAMREAIMRGSAGQ